MYTMKYYGFIKTSKDRYEAQLELVEAVLTRGIKPTARFSWAGALLPGPFKSPSQAVGA